MQLNLGPTLNEASIGGEFDVGGGQFTIGGGMRGDDKAFGIGFRKQFDDGGRAAFGRGAGPATIKVREYLKTLPKNTKLIVQPKIDGVAIALRYVNGKLVKAWTRKGVDKTERIKLVDNIPKNIWNVDKVDSRLTYEIRGELFAPNREAAQSQRLAAGFLRKKFAKDAEGLSFVAYEILNWSFLFKTEKDVLDN